MTPPASDSSSTVVMCARQLVPCSSASSAADHASGECVARSVGSAARYGANSPASPRDISAIM